MAPRARADARSHAEGGERGEDPMARSRDRILAAALEEFATCGFDGTTTGAVARRAGVTQPLVHYHFDSKEKLWRAAVGQACIDALSAFDGVQSELADLDVVDRMKVLVRRYVRYCAVHPEIARIVSYEGVRGGPRLQWLVDQHVTGRFDWFRHLFARGVDEGVLKPLSPEFVLSSISAAGAYLFIARAAMHDVHGIDVTDPAVIEAHADTVVELMFHGLVQPGTHEGRARHGGRDA